MKMLSGEILEKGRWSSLESCAQQRHHHIEYMRRERQEQQLPRHRLDRAETQVGEIN